MSIVNQEMISIWVGNTKPGLHDFRCILCKSLISKLSGEKVVVGNTVVSSKNAQMMCRKSHCKQLYTIYFR